MSLAAIQTWRTQDAPEPYRKLLEVIADPEERAEFVWVTHVPTEEHMQFWWGDIGRAAKPGSAAQNYRSGVSFYIRRYDAGYIVFTTNVNEDREIAAGG